MAFCRIRGLVKGDRGMHGRSAKKWSAFGDPNIRGHTSMGT